MHRMKKVSIIVMVMMLLTFTACQNKANETSPKSEESAATEVTEKVVSEAEGSILRYGMSYGPTNVDPTNLQEIVSYEMVRQAYNGLTDRTPEGKLIPGLAESWVTEDQGLSYHFVLKKGVKFHSGNELKASDVKFTFEHDLDPTRESSSASDLMSIVGAQDILDGKTKELSGFEILNDYEFKITFTEPMVYFPEYCSVENLYIVEEQQVKDKGETWWESGSAGTGPYKLTEFKVDEKVVFEAHKEYFNGAPKIDGIEFLVVPEDTTAFAMYENGELDVISAPWAELERIQSDEGLSKELVEYPIADMTYLGFSQKLYEPFKDIRVRQAISMVISQDDVANKILDDTVYPLYGVIPVDFNGYNKDIQKPVYDPAGAKALLKEAGYDETNPLPEVTLQYLPMDESVALYIQDQLSKELGWNIKLESPDRSALLDKLYAKESPMFIFGSTAAYGDPRAIMEVAFAKDARRNFSDYSNEVYDNALADTATMTKVEERNKLYHEAEKAIMEDYGFVPLYTGKSYMMIKPYVKEMKLSGLGMDILDTVVIEK